MYWTLRMWEPSQIIFRRTTTTTCFSSARDCRTSRRFGTITYNNYNGTANYNGLQLHFEHHQGNNLLITASYAWSHALDDSPGSNLSSTIPLYYYPQADYGNSLQDERHVFSSSILYNLPFGRGQNLAAVSATR